MSRRTERGGATESFVTYVLVMALAAYVAMHAKGALANIAAVIVLVGVGGPALFIGFFIAAGFGKLVSRLAGNAAEKQAQRRRALEYRERQEQEKLERQAKEMRAAARLRLKTESLREAIDAFAIPPTDA